MNLQRCAQGHFYDADKYDSCPHCKNSDAPAGHTVPLQQAGADIPPTMPQGGMGMRGGATVPIPPTEPLLDDGATICLDPMSEHGEKPVVGWLVCVKGKHLGKGFPLHSGKNFIGRSAGMNVCLDGEKSVSRDKHAIVLYDRMSNMFLAQQGESAELFYLNNSVVLSAVQIKKNDRLQIGNEELMLIPCCDDVFTWNDLNE